MLQGLLFTVEDVNVQKVQLNNIRANFLKKSDEEYQVELDVNSNKFLIDLKGIVGHINEFEIITMKGFWEMTNQGIVSLKKLVEHLWYRID